MSRSLVFASFLSAVGCSALGCAGSSLVGPTTLEQRALEPEGLRARIAREGDEPNGQVDHFAVLIGANTELRHRGNLSMAYQVLIEQGYHTSDIYVLDSEGGESQFFPATDVTSREVVHALFGHLKRIVEPRDTLLIYVTGHGRRVIAEQESNGARSTLGVSTILLNKTEEMTEPEFASLMDGIEPEVGIAFFDQCYGAIFSQATRACNFVFITTAAEDETSYGVSFPREFWNAFRAPGGVPPSIGEAFDRASAADKGTRMGYNSPRLTAGCLNPGALTLLGGKRPGRPVLSEATSVDAPR